MFKVECEGCQAPYDVDERRVPSAGLKMRCPKCGVSFIVRKPDTDAGAELPAVLGPKIQPRAANAAPTSPAPSGSAAGDAMVDLPAFRGGAATHRGAPTPREIKAPVDDFSVDLPAALGELPERLRSRDRSPAPPPPSPPPSTLPAPPSEPQGPARGFGEIDLPAVLSADLPMPASVGLPARPSTAPVAHEPPRTPARSVAAGLPAPRQPSLPAGPPEKRPVSSPAMNFGEIDLPLLSTPPPAVAAGLPSVRPPTPSVSPGARVPSLAPPQTGSEPPQEIKDDEWTDLGPAEPPPPPARSPSPFSEASPARHAAGGLEFGELDLGEAGSELNLAPSAPPAASRPRSSAPPTSDDDMEFGGIPQKSESGAPGLAPAPVPSRRPIPRVSLRAVPTAKPTGPSARMVAGVVAVLVIGGASLEVLTPYGAFGRHAVLDLIHADKLKAQQLATIDSAQAFVASDTFADSNRAIAFVDAAQASYPRIRGILAYGAFVGYATELRFGRGPQIDAHAKQQLAQIPSDRSFTQVDLARAAQAAVESQLPRARQILGSLAQRDKRNVDVPLLAGEVELLAKEPQKALDSFGRAVSLDGGKARSVFGIARANAALGNDDAAVTHAKKVLALSPHHVGARLLLARSQWNKSHDETGTMSLLGEITSQGPIREAASPAEIVEALTMMARVHMVRSRMTQAESALSEALKIDPKAGSALAGMGEVLYREGRFTDALARFEAGIQADPEGMAAKIGTAKTKIALERLQEAKEQLKKLRDARPTDFDTIYWLGRAEEALGDKVAAERVYEEAITAGGSKPEAVDAYVALAQLMASQGRAADAQAKLAEARKTLQPSATLHRAIGDVDLSAGRYEAARDEYESALKADSEDLAARFKLGTTLRRMNKFDDAQAALDKVSELDKDYPGLALERGLLYEASNRTREALAFYQQALAKAPDDPDMMLRVGSAEVVSGQASQAEEILRKVLSKRPNSAEVNHYLGRALLLKGTNLVEALRYLKRAVDADNNRAEYHLYVGWAANEAGQPAVARDELVKALELDKSMADAYWQMGVMQRKQGAVVDAMRNLQKAIELRPSRLEAFATLAECYEDENRPADAIAAWRKALSVEGFHPEWHYRLGKLLGRQGEGELRQAVTLSEDNDARPGWLGQAYFELADLERGSGKKADAIRHYRRFLALAKVDSPYRDDALRALVSLGAPYDNFAQ